MSRAPVALGLLVVFGCGEPAAPRPNVLLLVVDTLRADHTSMLGYERETTPNLERFAAGGLVFENVRASSSWTMPSTASMLTGLSAPEHGVETSTARLPEAATTLAEVLHGGGYRTALFSANPFVSRYFGFAQGYATVVDYATRPPRREGDARTVVREPDALRPDNTRDWAEPTDAAILNEKLLAWLDDGAGEQPWLAHVHYMEPHWPYLPPPPFDKRFGSTTQLPDLAELSSGFANFERGADLPEYTRHALIDAYDGAIAYWDDRFGALLAELEQRGMLEHTLVVVVSDHGEGFFEHATWLHQNSLHEELVRVPLLLRGPGVAAGRDRRSVTSVHLASTVLRLAGVGGTTLGSGRTLLDAGADHWSARLERKGRTLLATLEGADKWLVEQGEGTEAVRRFALALDPNEQHDRAAEQAETGLRMRAQLLRDAAAERAGGLALDHVETSPEMQQELRQLGYVK